MAPGCWPVLVSLECHVDVDGQKEMVKQMLGIWGDKLIQGKVENVTEDDKSVTPERLKGRIILMVGDNTYSDIFLVESVAFRSSIILRM